MAHESINFKTASSSSSDSDDSAGFRSKPERERRLAISTPTVLEHLPELLTPGALHSLSRHQESSDEQEQDSSRTSSKLFAALGGLGSGRKPKEQIGSVAKPGGKTRGDQPLLSDQEYREIRDAFELFDVTDSGGLDAKEIKVAFKALGIEITREEQRSLMVQFDDGEGTVNFDDFALVAHYKMEFRRRDEEIQKAFKLINDDGSGKISFKNLKRVALDIGENIPDEDLQEMLALVDSNGDGEIDEVEFKEVMDKMGAF